MMEAPALKVSIHEFEATADAPESRDRLLELIDGEIVEKMPTQKHGMTAGNIYGHAWNFVRERRLGRVMMEVRFQLPADDHNACIPAVSFMAGLDPVVVRGSVPRMPDWAVEIKSPDDSLKTMREKMRYYIANGVKLGWLVDPEKRFVEVYTAETERIYFDGDMLDGGDVLLGFSLPVSAIFEDTAV
jgi:Uma2 family endonuclease